MVRLIEVHVVGETAITVLQFDRCESTAAMAADGKLCSVLRRNLVVADGENCCRLVFVCMRTRDNATMQVLQVSASIGT